MQNAFVVKDEINVLLKTICLDVFTFLKQHTICCHWLNVEARVYLYLM